MYLERKRQEVSPDLFQLGSSNAVVATVIEILDVAGPCLLVVSHHLAPVPTALTGGHAHGVDFYWKRNLTV